MCTSRFLSVPRFAIWIRGAFPPKRTNRFNFIWRSDSRTLPLPRRPPAIRADHRAVHVTRGLAQQKQQNALTLLRSRESAHRDSRADFLEKSGILLVFNAARAQGSTAHAPFCPVRGEVARQTDESGFYDRIGHGFDRLLILGQTRLAIEALVWGDEAEVGGDVNDAPPLARDRGAVMLGAEKGAGQTHSNVRVPSRQREILQTQKILSSVAFHLGIVGSVVDRKS